MVTPDPPSWLQTQRDKWTHRGQRRPPGAIPPGQGQESVWDYPRPPALVEETRRVRVLLGSFTIAASTRAIRVLETASPPTVYVPQADVNLGFFEAVSGTSVCEWKGTARYYDVTAGDCCARQAAWTYPAPFEAFSQIADYFAFYPARVECWLGDERVRPQPGGFYGGWVTSEIVGPFKGELGTGGW